MKKIKFARITAFALCLITVFSFTGCGEKENSGTSDGNNSVTQEQDKNKPEKNKEDFMNVVINNKKISLPCTLDKIFDTGFKFFDENQAEEIYNSKNGDFLYISFESDDGNSFFGFMKTGPSPEKKEKNITVYAIINKVCKKDCFELSGGISVGSTVDEVKAVFKDTVVETAYLPATEDLPSTRILRYQTGDNYILMSFKNDVLSQFEIGVNQGE